MLNEVLTAIAAATGEGKKGGFGGERKGARTGQRQHVIHQ